ncbi:MAG: hypothetical protein ACKOEC_06510 [Acidimicrobiia bacterium]
MTFRGFAAAVLFSLLAPLSASAQSIDISANVVSSKWSEFDSADNGFGGRISFKPISLIGVEADVTWYPGEYEPDGVAFSRNRSEGLFGVTIGPKIDRIRPFAKVAAGFLRVGATPGAFACITIFPPPLNCSLASGDTLQAYEIGGGIEFDASRRFFIRGDIADRVLKYPGPTFDSNFDIQEDGFFGHAVRFTLGAGVRF